MCVVLLTACAYCVVDDTVVKLLPSIQWGSGVLGSAPVSGTLFFFCTSLTWPCWLVGKHQLSSFLWFNVPITPVTKIGFSGWDDSAPFLNICCVAGDIHVILWYEQIYLGKFCSGFAAVSGQVAELRRCLNIAVISAKGECTVKIKLANAVSPALNIKASIPCHSIWTITLFCFLLCFIVFFVQVFKLLFCCRIFFPSRVLVFLFVVDRIAGIHYLCAALCCCRIKLRKGKRILLPLPFVCLSLSHSLLKIVGVVHKILQHPCNCCLIVGFGFLLWTWTI